MDAASNDTTGIFCVSSNTGSTTTGMGATVTATATVTTGSDDTASIAIGTSMSPKRKRRKIRKPYYYSSSAVEHIENRCLMQAIQNSKVDLQIRRSNHTRSHDDRSKFDGTNSPLNDDDGDDDIPYGPVFFPTVRQFLYMNPIEYIAIHVKPIAERYGICKIVPPKGWQDHIKSHFMIPVVANGDISSEPMTATTTTTDDPVAPMVSSTSTSGNDNDATISNVNAPLTTSSDATESNSTTTNVSTTVDNKPTTGATASSSSTNTPDAADKAIQPTTPQETVPTVLNQNGGKAFETKYQLLHRIQEGIDFQDGSMYTSTEYIQMAYQQTLQYKTKKYPLHDLLSKYQNDAPMAGEHPPCSTGSSNDAQPQKDETKDDTDSSDNTSKNANASKHLFSIRNLEQDYWDIVEMVQQSDHSGNNKFVVEYGNDVDTHIFGSGFPLSHDPSKSIFTAKTATTKSAAIDGEDETTTASADTTTTTTTNIDEDDDAKLQEVFQTEGYYRDSLWNLNNIPCAPQSVLRHVKVAINGINVPWMYFGSLFTTFCWHNEDNYLYSINYHHMGSPKQWYGVPGIPKDSPEGLEKVFKSYLSMKMRDVPDLLHHITTMFSPRLVKNRNVPVCKIVQYEGEFVVTFPRAYHCGFSYGPNIGEAVNFASSDWIPYGADANEKYRTNQRPAVFSHDRLVYTLANHCERDQRSYHTCKLLLNELQRIIDEELSLRTKLLNGGVRDVSSLIHLRPNRFDQLDEASANYDDQRTCHYCKYICYFTAVACQCSHSKVSCLRHSHFMCTCVNTSKYLMIWSAKVELLATLDRVKKHCDGLYQKENNGKNCDKSDVGATCSTNVSTGGTGGDGKSKSKVDTVALPEIAPGAKEDYERHKTDPIFTDPTTWMRR